MPGYGPGFGNPAGPPPNNYLGWAIASTLLCCLPAGIVAIVFAAQVNGKWMAGDFQGAMTSSRNAKIWTIVSACMLVPIVVIWLIFAVALAHTAATIPTRVPYSP
jgi:hypothetical protein